MKKYIAQRTALVILFFLLVITPLIILILGPAPSSNRNPWLDVSVSMGFAGLSIMALQFALTARIKPLKKPFGSDLIYYFHRQISIAAFLMVLAHPIMLFVIDPKYLRLLNIITAPWRARAGVTSVMLLIGLVLTAEYRKKVKMPYGFWKLWHGIIATLTVGTALVHIFLVGNYVNLPWKQVVWIGYTALLLGLITYTRIIYPIKLMRNPYEVVSVNKERGGTWTVRMRPKKGKILRFNAGQFAWITAWKTPFSDTEHPFSLSSSAANSDFIEMSIKNLGPFTATVREFKPGQQVYMDGPYGAFTLERYANAGKLIFIPGGIGITPLMSMMRTMADRGDQRPIKLFYCNRDWETVTFREEIDALKKKLDLEVIYTLEIPPEEWDGEKGYLSNDILAEHLPSEWMRVDTEVFLCGPQIMMDFVQKNLLNLGIPLQRIHFERFNLV